ncbi:MAG: TetR/AcrR family transcriptional regulator [Streptosporangiales bacterium]|nr:TetR/AcrR family transcriptional regulator [Streptosporangiales bacterium]
MMAAIELVRERGVEGTGLSDLLERSSSARRSIYQHFPGGKLELIDASTRAAGAFAQAAIREFGATMSSRELVTAMIRLISDSLSGSGFRLGCPIAAAAYAPADTIAVLDAAADAFAGWAAEIEAVLAREGRPEAEARSLAGFIVSGVEGALLRARASRSTEPLDDAADQLTRLVQDR